MKSSVFILPLNLMGLCLSQIQTQARNIMKASEFLKQYEARKKREAEEQEGIEREHTLQENALERARNPGSLNAGTPFDWEDLEAYEKELKRMDREGPGRGSDKQSD